MPTHVTAKTKPDGHADSAAINRSLKAPRDLNRRDFMRVSGTMAAAGAIGASACKPPAETSLPFNARPEGLRTPGKAKLYASVLDDTPVLIRCREGRPLLINRNAQAPGGRGMSLRHHAALLDLYDPDRAQTPLWLRRGQAASQVVGYRAVADKVVAALKDPGTKTVLLTGPLSGPATRALMQHLQTQLGVEHLSYDAAGDDVAQAVFAQVRGSGARPRPRLDRADLIVGLGAEFIDQPADGLEADFARRRSPDDAAGMSRFVQFESRLSLTGAAADQRLRVRDSQLARVALALLHQVAVVRKVGSPDAHTIQTLAGFAADKLNKKQHGVDASVIEKLASTLIARAQKCVVIAGGAASHSASGVALETAVLLLNQVLGNLGSPMFEPAAAALRHTGGAARLQKLAQDLKAGEVGTLLVAGCNPVYDAPAGLDFAAAMRKATLLVSLNDRVDETAAHADYLVPASHPLESWGDATIGAHTYALQQPVIQPLYNTFGLLDLLIAWAAAAGAQGPIAQAFAAALRKAAPKAAAPQVPSGAYHFIRAHWRAELLRSNKNWDETLRRGSVQVKPDLKTPMAAEPKPAPDSQPADSQPADDSEPHDQATAGAQLSALLTTGVEASSAELELQLHPHIALHDGRAANNGWLLELPDPITRLTWGNALSMAPRRFDAMGLRDGDLMEIEVGGHKLTLPAYRHAGMHDNVLSLPLGFGRARCGKIGHEVGVNGFVLQRLEQGRWLRAGLAVSLRKTGERVELADGQGADVIDRSKRQLVPFAPLSAVKKDPRAGTEQIPGGPSAWPEHPYEHQRWAMAIDLSKCNGCGKCVIGCQAENNVPVVGRQNIIDGREMSWMRIDRYYDAPQKKGGRGDEVWDGPLDVVEEPRTLFEPMLCQHCENAPCETVCPFNATMHSADGLNQQIYNRCVGTRYCANNCPFKVRRYNWYEYSTRRGSWLFKKLFPRLIRHALLNVRGRMQMKNNPEVTVRSRGVMEKCSFCVQRIREARAEAIRTGHDKLALPDGAVQPACMEACPTGAIVFGDINDPNSAVHKAANSDRAMRLLESTGVKPSVSYLTRVYHDEA